MSGLPLVLAPSTTPEISPPPFEAKTSPRQQSLWAPCWACWAWVAWATLWGGRGPCRPGVLRNGYVLKVEVEGFNISVAEVACINIYIYMYRTRKILTLIILIVELFRNFGATCINLITHWCRFVSSHQVTLSFTVLGAVIPALAFGSSGSIYGTVLLGRLLLGVGVGGIYPLSAVSSAEGCEARPRWAGAGLGRGERRERKEEKRVLSTWDWREERSLLQCCDRYMLG